MNVIGIVGEYNPFHLGHAYHINKTKELLGEDCPVVCAMSGDFVQRGEAAVFSKYARAEAACKSGADLVLELPLPWVLSSAEGFARGAVGLLGAVGVVTHLSFGSESGELSQLETLAEALLDPFIGADIRRVLAENEGISFAAARQKALYGRVGETAELLSVPNNILAVEYIKTVYDNGFDMKPVTVRRMGAGHDMIVESGLRSASDLRTRLARGGDIDAFVPASASEVYRREERLGRGPVMAESIEQAVLSRLRMLSAAGFAALPDAGEGLDNRLMKACREESGIDAVLAAAKSKRYAMSRLRRMLMCAVLGVTDGMASGIPPYASVLAANARVCALLKDMNARSRIPVLTKPASVKELEPECVSLFELGAAAHDLYVLGYAAREERKGGADWKSSPKIL